MMRPVRRQIGRLALTLIACVPSLASAQWTEAGRQKIVDNASAVRALLIKAQSDPRINAAYKKCLVLESEYARGLIPSIRQAQQRSEKRSEIALYDDLIRAYEAEAPTIAEGICAWKFAAWTSGLADFNPKQFDADPRTGSFGQTEALSRVANLQCRQAGDEVRVLKPYGLECAAQFAKAAVAKLDDPDLAPTAFARLNSLLVSPLPPEFVIFDKMAEVVWSFSRFSKANQVAYCHAIWTGGCPDQAAPEP